MAMILSASLAAAAATQGAGSTCGSVTGSVLVANAWCGSVAHRTEATATLRIRAEKPSRIDLSCGSLFDIGTSVASGARFEQPRIFGRSYLRILMLDWRAVLISIDQQGYQA
jgi:hypothetical protein